MTKAFTHSAAILCVILNALTWRVESRGVKIPFVSKLRKKEYTPLVFFTSPKGIVAECDEMETIVSEVEKELDVRVERLDVLRDTGAQETLSMLTNQPVPPFLYHRESCQIVRSPSVTVGTKKKDDQDEESEGIDKARVRAWAKGRFLPPPGVKVGASLKKSSNPTVVSQDETALDQAELIKEQSLTPEQIAGKRAMEERTEAAKK